MTVELLTPHDYDVDFHRLTVTGSAEYVRRRDEKKEAKEEEKIVVKGVKASKPPKKEPFLKSRVKHKVKKEEDVSANDGVPSRKKGTKRKATSPPDSSDDEEFLPSLKAGTRSRGTKAVKLRR